jgi:protein-tyrosine phosphatase
MTRVLFLCSGNYYRSRFAEILFNHLAAEAGVPVRADSCGLRVQADGVVNVGAISRHAVEGLRVRHLPLPPERFPRQVTEADLRGAQIVVALKEAEHRPMMENLFPQYAGKIRYWHVHDLDVALPEVALAELENLVRALFAECVRACQCPKSAKN